VSWSLNLRSLSSQVLLPQLVVEQAVMEVVVRAQIFWRRILRMTKMKTNWRKKKNLSSSVGFFYVFV
jgi:hypothetical protein